MIKVTSVPLNKKSIPFEKNRKEIIAEASNNELKKIVKDVTKDYDIDTVIDFGIPKLLKYAQRGDSQKKEATSILKDVIESEQIRTSPCRKTIFYGVGGDEELDDGYLGAYEKLTGIRLDVNI